MRVLVVEDQAEMAEMVATGLRRAQMAVDVALDGPSGLERALINDYDVLVLDRDLPGLHGDEICVLLIAAGRRSRVLMLTGAADSQALVEGLGLVLMTISASRSTSLSSSPASARWRAGLTRSRLRCSASPTWSSTRRSGGRPVPGGQ